MTSEMAGFTPAYLYDYLVKSRAKIFDWVRPLSLEQYTKEFGFGKKSLRATLAHIAASEWSYIRRIREESTGLKAIEDHPFWKYNDTAFAPLETAWKELTEDTRRTLRRVTNWSKPVEYATTADPKVRIRTITGGIAGQLLFHEIHHRAQAMAMLRQFGVPAENIDYSVLNVERIKLPT